MNLKDFSNTKPTYIQKEKLEKAKEDAERLKRQDSQAFRGYEEQIEKYGAMPQDSLMEELVRQTAEEKASGNLDNAQIDNVYKNLAPMLNEEQKNRLENLIKMIK